MMKNDKSNYKNDRIQFLSFSCSGVYQNLLEKLIILIDLLHEYQTSNTRLCHLIIISNQFDKEIEKNRSELNRIVQQY